MFREIRRKKKEISIDEAKKLLKYARRGVLAVHGEDGYPYAFPLNYFYDEKNENIIFHGAKAGHKFDALKANNKVCFTVMGAEKIKAETWAPFIQSAIVFGRCHLIEDQDDAMALLKQFALKYYPDENLVMEEIAKMGKATQMFCIQIEHLRGKEVQEK